MKVVKLENLTPMMEALSDNREETIEGSLCVALFFPDPTYYLFEAEKVTDEEFQEDLGRYVVQCDENCVGFIESAYYWRVLDKHHGANIKHKETIKAQKKLENLRDKVIFEEWTNARLYSPLNKDDDVHIESDGWAIDGNHYSRTFYVSVNGAESIRRTFDIEFHVGTDEVLSTHIS